MCDTKAVPLAHWLQGLYSDEVWEVRGYSEFGYDGTPKYVELRRKEKEDVQTA